jgi:phosphoadenosine phosphosulfate reductase
MPPFSLPILSSASLRRKIATGTDVLKRMLDNCAIEEIACTFTGGKDSLVALHLLRTAAGGKVPCKVLRLDTSVKFPEIIAFVSEMQMRWEFDLVVARNDAALSSAEFRIAEDPAACCKALKVDALNAAIVEHGIRSLVTGVRADEQEQRRDEQHVSPRSSPPHVRYNPVLDFSEADIWAYIRQHELPYCTLYDQGYRSIGCVPCTQKVVDPKAPERMGRSLAKEQIMQNLRGMGYF